MFQKSNVSSKLERCLWNCLDGNEGMVSGKCPNRAESSSMDNKTKSLVLMNFFPDNPSLISACSNNSAPLLSMLNTCHSASANRWANYIAVDFYKVFRSCIFLVGYWSFNLIFVILKPLFFIFILEEWWRWCSSGDWCGKWALGLWLWQHRILQGLCLWLESCYIGMHFFLKTRQRLTGVLGWIFIAWLKPNWYNARSMIETWLVEIP